MFDLRNDKLNSVPALYLHLLHGLVEAGDDRLRPYSVVVGILRLEAVIECLAIQRGLRNECRQSGQASGPRRAHVVGAQRW